jgi:beta-xylosidase
MFAQKYTTFTPGEIWYDNNGTHINAHGGGILYYNNTYYWFGEHKTEGRAGNTAQVGVHCYSSNDLYNWNDEGIVLKVDDDPDSDITKGCILERPKVIYNRKTGKFVMWFHLELKGKGYVSALCGIAVADRITGPYKFLRSTRATPGFYPVNVLDEHKQPVKQSVIDRNLFGGTLRNQHPDSLNIIGRDLIEGQMARDMQLFVDDDGKAYHLFASETNSTLHIAELTDDYLGHTGKYMRAFVNRYMEAPAVFKKNNLYYFMGSDCTGWRPNAARSAVAPSIWGPWTELGNPCVDEEKETTYDSQSTYILPVQGKNNVFIYMGDRWRPDNAIDGRYIWLPIEFEDGRFIIHWHNQWKLEDQR